MAVQFPPNKSQWDPRALAFFSKDKVLFIWTTATLLTVDLLEEIIALVIDQNECREVFHFDFVDRFHAQFWVFHAFQTLDAFLRQTAAGPPILPR